MNCTLCSLALSIRSERTFGNHLHGETCPRLWHQSKHMYGHRWLADLVIAGSFKFLDDMVTLTALHAHVEESADGITFKVNIAV